MQKFRLIFHIVYMIVALTVMYFSMDILMNTQEYLSKIKIPSYIKFLHYLMSAYLFISILMVVEFVLQQIKVRNSKNEIEDLQNEVIALKARLYDKSQEEDDDNDDGDDDD